MSASTRREVAQAVVEVGERIQRQSASGLDDIVGGLLVRSGAAHGGDHVNVLDLDTATCLAIAWLQTKTWED